MPRRRSRDFFIVEQHFFDSDPRYTGMELDDQQRYLRLWSRAKRTRHEVIPNVDTVTPDGRRALTRLLRTSTRSLDACLARLTAPGAPNDPLIGITKQGYIRVYGCSKVHGVDRNSVHYVDPDSDVDSDSHSEIDKDSDSAGDAPRPEREESSPATDHMEPKDSTTKAPPGGTFKGPKQREPEHVFQGMKRVAQSLKAKEVTVPRDAFTRRTRPIRLGLTDEDHEDHGEESVHIHVKPKSTEALKETKVTAPVPPAAGKARPTSFSEHPPSLMKQLADKAEKKREAERG